MRFLTSFLILSLAVIGMTALAHASDDLIVIEQDYNIVEHSRKGFDAKDIRQVLYVTKDMLVIDEFGDSTKIPTETFRIDLKNERIVDLDHTSKEILLNESFADRRKQILTRKKQVQSDMDAQEPGAVKNKLMKLFGPMLDANRQFKIVEAAPTKVLKGLTCKTVKIVDASDDTYPAFVFAQHPEIEMPYDNSEVLFLLKIVGEKMAAFLKENNASLGHVPMEMHLELAEGGKLDSKVVSVKKMKLAEFDPSTRALGDPFKFPEGYSHVRKFVPKTPDAPKEKAD